MGRFLAIAMILSGCGRLGFDGVGPGPGMDPTDPPDPTMDPTPKTLQTCAVAGFTTQLVNGVDDLDLAVAVTPSGASLFGVDKAGGDLRGLELSSDFLSAGPSTLVRAGNFSATSASYVAGTQIVAGLSGSIAVVHKVPAGHANPTEIAMLDAMFIAKNTMLLANGDRVTPTACSAGLTVNPFDASWAPTTSQLAVTTGQSTGLASTPFGTDAMVVWSTMTSCHLERVIHLAQGTGGMQSWACPFPRIAANVAASTGTLVYEGGDGVRMASFTSDSVDASSTLVAAGATSPRIAFDGTSYWIAYLDHAGAITVGYVDATGAFQATTTDLTAAHDAFELTIAGGKVWVVSAGQTGVAARQICIQ